MNDEAARQGRPDADHLDCRITAAAALPDPALYRQSLPGRLLRAWEFGEVGTREEFWHRLERLWGADEVMRFLCRSRAG